MLRRKAIYILAIGSIFGANTALAAFGVQSNKWPSQKGQYGHSYNENFYDAVTGSGQVTESEKAELEEILPNKVDDRVYFRVSGVIANLKVSGIKNISSSDATRARVVQSKDIKKNEKEVQLAIGWNAKQWHTELEYILGESMDYNISPVLSGGTEAITSKISGDTLFANAYYDISRVSFFQPYVMGGLGISTNKVTSQLDAQSSRKKVVYGIAYTFGLGFRLHLINPAWMSNFYIDANYRYYILGNAKWDDVNNDFKLKGNRSVRGFGLGITYVF